MTQRVPALAAIDPTIPGTAIKDRPESDPLAPATLERIKAGIRRWWLPLLTHAGGTWRDQALPLDMPMPTRTGPVGTLITRERYGLTQPPADQHATDHDVNELLGDVLFRMLEPHEVATAMAFDPTYRVLARAKRHKVRLYGNAVTPPAAEIIMSALVETITAEPLAKP